MNFNKSFNFSRELSFPWHKYIFRLILLLIGFSVIAKDLFKLDFSLLLSTIQDLNFLHLLVFFILGTLAVSLISIYDLILRREFNLDISIRDTIKIAWTSNIIGNFLGEDSTHSQGISYLLYQSEGIDSNKATLISIIKNTLFIITPEDSDIDFLKLSVRTRIHLVLGLLIKWFASACFFIYILRNFSVVTPITSLFLVFVLAASIGLVSGIPGGLGIFELVCLYSLSFLGVSIDSAVLGVLAYRLFYHVIPWVITLFILAIKPKLTNKIKLSPANKRLLQAVSVQATASLILFAGLLLIFTASLPSIFDTVPISRFAGMGIGLILLILSKGIYNKVQSSYYFSLLFLGLGTLFIMIYDFSFIEVLLLISIACVLYSAKECFYRAPKTLSLKNYLLGLSFITPISILYLAICTMLWEGKSLFSIGYFIFNQWSDFILFLLFMLASALLLNLVGVKKIDFLTPSDADLEALTHFLEKYEGNSMTHLLFLKDKSFFYTMDNQVLIAFRPYRDNLMVLGDPIGEVTLFKDAINEFRIYADKFNMTPIFYEVSEKHLPLYHENGFNFLKLGEEATMSLNDFSFSGKKSASLRTIRNKILRNEFEFEILYPPFSPELLASLKEISDSWLGDRHEKVFSLGSFNEGYINLSPIALVKKDGQLLSFATIMPMYQEHIFSIDLMRLVPDSPNGTMEATFIGIIDWAKEEGYTHFVLGKAPLSNVGITQFSSKKEKMVKHFYNYGNRLYSFKGLRYFKEKFSPTWECTYLAYPKNTKLSLVILNLARMISGKNENKK